ncbi:hypothetical protein SAMN05216283_107179 [Sunxiuqinia elliptica]|uniref:Uncharacterized protein n=1 Tax=Sunxiuqinia elliptica TaxID=655355 RepID=A0A1I2J3Y6_9BACT|nr:hypothetical protein SAMN05216283_107179 [Sunxiuqinia elliptica]
MCFDDKNTKYNRGICLVGENRHKLTFEIVSWSELKFDLFKKLLFVFGAGINSKQVVEMGEVRKYYKNKKVDPLAYLFSLN